MGVAERGDLDKARVAVIALAEHRDPLVEDWFASAGVGIDGPLDQLTRDQIRGFLSAAALERLGARLHNAPISFSEDAENALEAMFEQIRSFMMWTPEEWREMAGGESEGGHSVRWRRAEAAVRVPLMEHEIERQVAAGQARDVSRLTLHLLDSYGQLTGHAGRIHSFVLEFARDHLNENPDLGEILIGDRINAAEHAGTEHERRDALEDALGQLCAMTAETLPGGGRPQGPWRGPAVVTHGQATLARNIIDLALRNRSAGGTEATREWYSQAAITAALAARGADPTILLSVAGLVRDRSLRDGFVLAAIEGMTANRRLGAISAPPVFERVAQAIDPRDQYAAGQMTASSVVRGMWGQVSRGGMDLTMHGGRYHQAVHDASRVAHALDTLFGHVSRWTDPDAGRTGLADLSVELMRSGWAEDVASVAIPRLVEINRPDRAIDVVRRAGEIASGSSGSLLMRSARLASLSAAVSGVDGYRSGALLALVNALEPQPGDPALTNGEDRRIEFTTVEDRVTPLRTLASWALLSRDEMGVAVLQRIIEQATVDASRGNEEIKALGALAAVALGDNDLAAQFAHNTQWVTVSQPVSAVPAFIKNAVSYRGPQPADGQPPWIWNLARLVRIDGTSLADRLAAIASDREIPDPSAGAGVIPWELPAGYHRWAPPLPVALVPALPVAETPRGGTPGVPPMGAPARGTAAGQPLGPAGGDHAQSSIASFLATVRAALRPGRGGHGRNGGGMAL